MSLAFRIFILPSLFLLGGSVDSCENHGKAGCKQRAEAYRARVDQLRKDAHEQLKIGTRQYLVQQFFNAHGLPFEVIRSGDHKEAIGTVYVQGGCAPVGCGSENALIGLRTELNVDGSLIAKPVIGAQFTDCL